MDERYVEEEESKDGEEGDEDEKTGTRGAEAADVLVDVTSKLSILWCAENNEVELRVNVENSKEKKVIKCFKIVFCDKI